MTIPVNLALPVESATSLSPTIIFWLVASIVIPAPTCIRSALGSKVIVWVPIVRMPVILALPNTSRANPDFADVPIPTFLVVWIPTESTAQVLPAPTDGSPPINFLVAELYWRK